MKNIILTLIVLFLFSIVCINCNNPCDSREKLPTKKIIVFIDAVNGNQDFFKSHCLPRIKKMIASNQSKKNIFTLKVYPITGNSSAENDILSYNLDKNESQKICNIQGETNRQASRIMRKFNKSKSIFEKKDTSLSIFYTIPKLSKELANRGGYDQNIIIYISDLVELHNPIDEENGFFSFIETGTNKLDITSISLAQQQLTDSTSKLRELISESNIKNSKNKILVFRPNTVIVNPDVYGNRVHKIIQFWENFFKELETSIEVFDLSDFEILDEVLCK